MLAAMARYGHHADRLQDPLVNEVWMLIRTCNRMQAALVRNLAAHHLAALDGFSDEGRPGCFRDDELIVAILDADLAKRQGTEKREPLQTVADYKLWKAEGAPSATTICRAFGGWPEAMRAAHAYAVKGSNRHLMIREGVSQTGAKRVKVTARDCVLALAACIEESFGHRPSWEQYATFALNETSHRPSAKTISAKLGGWEAACDQAMEEIPRQPELYPHSQRLWSILEGLNGPQSQADGDGA